MYRILRPRLVTNQRKHGSISCSFTTVSCLLEFNSHFNMDKRAKKIMQKEQSYEAQ